MCFLPILLQSSANPKGQWWLYLGSNPSPRMPVAEGRFCWGFPTKLYYVIDDSILGGEVNPSYSILFLDGSELRHQLRLVVEIPLFTRVLAPSQVVFPWDFWVISTISSNSPNVPNGKRWKLLETLISELHRYVVREPLGVVGGGKRGFRELKWIVF